MLELYRLSSAFWKRDARLALSYPLQFIMSLGGVFVRLLAMWLPAQLLEGSTTFSGQGGFIPYAVVGTSIMGVFMASYGGFSDSVRGEQAMGTLESVLMTPAHLGAVVLGSSSWMMTRALLDATLTLMGAVVIYGMQVRGNPLEILLVVLLTNLSFIGIGMFSAAFAIVLKRGDPIRPFIAGASFLLGGVIYPTNVLPEWLRNLAEFLPVTHGARALRGVILAGDNLWEHKVEVLSLLGFAVVLLPLGLTVFKRALARAQEDGSLLQY